MYIAPSLSWKKVKKYIKEVVNDSIFEQLWRLTVHCKADRWMPSLEVGFYLTVRMTTWQRPKIRASGL